MLNIIPSNTSKDIAIDTMLAILLITILVLTGYYINYQIRKKPIKDKLMGKTLNDVNTQISSVNIADASKQHNLRDYYIMSSYNSCCNGNFKDGYVSLSALQDVIRKGARLLDFEIYNIGENPVVACSTSDSFNFKGSYNSIPFKEVIDIVGSHAFSASTSPNFNDPLIIHLRVKTKNANVCEKIGKTISSQLDRYRLDNKYDNGYNIGGTHESLMKEPLKNFLGKVIIITDRSNTSFIGTGLDEVTNMYSSSMFCQQLRNYDVTYTPSVTELIEHNKKNTTISMIDLKNNSPFNMDASVHMKLGCQMICMNFQSVDDNLLFYLDQFNEAGSAFILRPPQLRYIPMKSKIPKKQNPELSYAPKLLQKPYFSHEF